MPEFHVGREMRSEFFKFTANAVISAPIRAANRGRYTQNSRISAFAAASSPFPQSKSAVADFDHSIDGPKPAYTRFRLGEGQGGGSGGCGNDVPPLSTPTPSPPHEGGGRRLPSQA